MENIDEAPREEEGDRTILLAMSRIVENERWESGSMFVSTKWRRACDSIGVVSKAERRNNEMSIRFGSAALDLPMSARYLSYECCWMLLYGLKRLDEDAEEQIGKDEDGEGEVMVEVEEKGVVCRCRLLLGNNRL